MDAINYLYVGERGSEHPCSSSEWAAAAVLKVMGGSGGWVDILSFSFLIFLFI